MTTQSVPSLRKTLFTSRKTATSFSTYSETVFSRPIWRSIRTAPQGHSPWKIFRSVADGLPLRADEPGFFGSS